MTHIFDKKFGETFVAGVPQSPGVYRYYRTDGTLVYVGKAKDLRRRLSQYRNSGRAKAHSKMRRIVRASARLEFEVTATEKEALLLENALIQAHKPPLNVAGAFCFLYPYIGLKRTEHHLCMTYSTGLDDVQSHGFEAFGCYRNRTVARAGFDALMSVFVWVGHRERGADRIPFATSRRYRQIPDSLDEGLRSLLRGDSQDILEGVMMLLIEKPAARRDAAEVQASLKTLRLFYEYEGTRLRRLRDMTGADCIGQHERDALDIRAGFDDCDTQDR
jgi:excinuclease ABC subunit C